MPSTVLLYYVNDNNHWDGSGSGAAYYWGKVVLTYGGGTYSVSLSKDGSGGTGDVPNEYRPIPTGSEEFNALFIDGELVKDICDSTTKISIFYNESFFGDDVNNFVTTTVETNSIDCGFVTGVINSVTDDISISSNCAIIPRVDYDCGYTNHRLTIEIDKGAGYTNLVNLDEPNNGNFSKTTTYNGLNAGTSYNIRVRLYDSAGGTLLDEEIVSLSTDNVATSITFNSITANSISATGAGSQYAGWTYEVQRQVDGGGWVTVETHSLPGGTALSTTNSYQGGEYRIKFTTGCGDEAISSTLQLCNLTIDSITKVDQQSVGTTTGSITIYASGGVGGVEYSIDGSNWSSYPTFYVQPGTYTAYVRETWRVSCNDNQTNIVIAEFNPTCSLSVTEITTTDESTAGAADGTITITATASGTIEYSKDGGSNWQTSNQFTGLADGAYDIKVREQAEPTCEYSQTVVIFEGDVYTCDINISVSVQNESVSGEEDGQITVTASNGQSPYEYRIGGTGSWQDSNVFTGLAAGDYVVEAREKNTISCAVNTLATVQEGTSCPVVQSTPVVNYRDRSQFGGTDSLGTISLVFLGLGDWNGLLEFRLLNSNRTVNTNWKDWVWSSDYSFSSLEGGTYYIQYRVKSDGSCFNEVQVLVDIEYLSEVELSESCPSPYYITNSLTVTGYGNELTPEASLAEAQADAENKLITQLVCRLDRTMFVEADSRDIDTGLFTLSYYPRRKSWVSFHNYYPSFYITTRKKLYNFYDGIAYKFTNSYKFGLYYDDTIRDMFIEFVANPQQDLSKLFSFISWITVLTKSNGEDVLDKTFDKIRALSSGKSIVETTLTNYVNTGNLGDLRNLNNTWYFNNLQNASESIETRKRIIDKFMRVQLTYNNSKDLDNLQYLLSLHSFNVDFKVVK